MCVENNNCVPVKRFENTGLLSTCIRLYDVFLQLSLEYQKFEVI